MATWKDGAAYAPVERPDGFATPVADPLPVAEPYRAATPGPMHHPGGFDSAQQRPLDQLGVSTSTQRNPKDSFAVASLAMTAGPGKSSARDPRQPFASSATVVTSDDPPPPTGQPLAVPGPPPLPQYTGQYGGARPPAPGVGTRPTQPPPQQWAPPSPQAFNGAPQQYDPTLQSQRVMGWTAAVLSFFGLLLSGSAPFVLIIAGVLGLRVRKLTTWVGPTALGIGLFGLLVQLGLGELGSPNPLLGVLSLLCCLGFSIAMLRSPGR